MAEFLNIYIFHWTPEKAIYISGQTLPWDARCNGIYIGFAISVLWQFLLSKKARNLPPWPILIINTFMFIPMFIDLISIWTGMREPSNNVRYLTGILFGGALGIYLYPAFISLVFKNAKNFSSINSLIYGLFLLTSIGTFFIKRIDSTFVYWMLYSLSVSGFGCLVLMLLASSGCMSKHFISRVL